MRVLLLQTLKFPDEPVILRVADFRAIEHVVAVVVAVYVRLELLYSLLDLYLVSHQLNYSIVGALTGWERRR